LPAEQVELIPRLIKCGRERLRKLAAASSATTPTTISRDKQVLDLITKESKKLA
jgi:hypothetical protein